MKPYLATALWGHGSGFCFTTKPPPGVERLEQLQSRDPDDVLACVLANFQCGNFEVASALLPLMQRDESAYIWSAGANLLAHAAPQAEVRRFFDWAHGLPDDASRYEACATALIAGNLWAVDAALALHAELSDPNLRQFLRADLSWLLEASTAEVFAGPALQNASDEDEEQPFSIEPRFDHAGYASSVLSIRDSIAAGFPPAAAVAEGAPIHVVDIAQRLLRQLGSEDASRARLEHAWWMFGAITGVDCRAFFSDDGNLQRLSAAAIVEDYLDSFDAQFQPGVRYFFGHRIPD